jgi:hypothetical protein
MHIGTSSYLVYSYYCRRSSRSRLAAGRAARGRLAVGSAARVGRLLIKQRGLVSCRQSSKGRLAAGSAARVYCNSRRIGAIIVWFVVRLIGVSARALVSFG